MSARTPGGRPVALDLPPYAGEPVAIVGNGPVGQTLALLLARWGIPSVLLDRRSRRDLVGSKAICQHRDVLDVWDTVGAGRTVAEEGLTWTRARTFYRGRELFCLDLPDSGRSAFPPFVNISQSRTEQVLDARIAESALVDARWDHAVTSVGQTDENVALTVSTGAGERILRAPYAVLCSGGHSDTLRRDLDVSFEGRSFDDHFLICDIQADLPGWELERRFYFDPEWNPGRQVLIHPCPGSTYRIDWQVPAEFDLAEEERTGALDRRIRRIVGDSAYSVVWKSVYRFHSRCASRMRAGRVLLAGDSAHLMAPFGARGLNSGVADADNAAWKLAFVLRGWAGPDLLDSYERERRAAARENLDVTSTTMDFLVPQDDDAWARRRAALERAAADPGAAGDVDSGRLYESFWYADSPLCTPDPVRAPATRPPKGSLPAPGVGVLLPDCPVRDPEAGRLRMLARLGVLVLAVDAAALEVAQEAVRDVAPAPVRVRAMPALSPDGTVVRSLGARSGEVWVVRPDAHVAAVLSEPGVEALCAAVRRSIGRRATADISPSAD
jgi:3-(3-hydroxy-phenyl)propionate hydroxylase